MWNLWALHLRIFGFCLMGVAIWTRNVRHRTKSRNKNMEIITFSLNDSEFSAGLWWSMTMSESVRKRSNSTPDNSIKSCMCPEFNLFQGIKSSWNIASYNIKSMLRILIKSFRRNLVDILLSTDHTFIAGNIQIYCIMEPNLTPVYSHYRWIGLNNKSRVQVLFLLFINLRYCPSVKLEQPLLIFS